MNKNYRFVELSNGKTCYEEQGDRGSSSVVFIHGLSSPMCIWDRNFYAVADAGFHTLRYDLYGRGYSARPLVKYDSNLFTLQLKELIEKLELTLPVHLIGLSMGGAIAVDFTSKYPDWIRTVILIAPAGLLKKTFSIRLITFPLVGTVFYELIGKRALLNGVLSTLGEDEQGRREMIIAYKEQMAIAGYREAILSSLKYGPLYDLEESYKKLGAMNKFGKLIWGAKDDVVPPQFHRKIQEFVPWLELHLIENGTHAVNFQQPDVVNSIIIDFLKGYIKE